MPIPVHVRLESRRALQEPTRHRTSPHTLVLIIPYQQPRGEEGLYRRVHSLGREIARQLRAHRCFSPESRTANSYSSKSAHKKARNRRTSSRDSVLTTACLARLRELRTLRFEKLEKFLGNQDTNDWSCTMSPARSSWVATMAVRSKFCFARCNAVNKSIDGEHVTPHNQCTCSLRTAAPLTWPRVLWDRTC
jgi:hypothetical protein